MKTLDELITAMENLTTCDDTGCSYIEHDDVVDAVHYLVEYRDRKETLRNWTEKAISEQQNLSDAITFMQAYRDDKDDLTALRAYWKEQHENNALTWDELKQMRGQPVWIEDPGQKEWRIIDHVVDEDTKYERLYTQGFYPRTFYKHDHQWQAYRKERE